MELPAVLTNSRVYAQLAEDRELLSAVVALRSVAGSLADTVTRTVPTFTDHTLRHMDALWGIADKILLPAETDRLTPGEAFVLGCGFYLHDIGMAYAATDAGLEQVQRSPVYTGFLGKAPPESQAKVSLQAAALAYAVRTLHAGVATELATKPIPGTEIYLFDNKQIREAWGETCGRVAASHHWSLDRVERELGATEVIPLPGGHQGDLGFVASLLRLIDYAHINRQRAFKIDRAFRQSLEQESLIHWLAQESVDGPERDGGDLVYHAAVPIANVDAWWLYYEMLKGLDEEIRNVRHYLDRRLASHGRLSLQGVRGATSPDEAVAFIGTNGFLPIEVNLRTGSIEKLVQLLAGETLYGPDPMTAVRELIQNSRDAVMLKATVAESPFEKASLTIPIRIAMRTEESGGVLEVIDAGVGMTRKVMTDYLITIASDYWTSQFHTDYPAARDRGFQPAGRFGIGFLSVFMLGDEVTVESNRNGGERYQLQLRGVGRRGEIRSRPSQSGSGTAVRVRLRQSVVPSLRELAQLVRVYAPTLPHMVEVDVDGQTVTIPVDWLHDLTPQDFHRWTLESIATLARNRQHRDLTGQYVRLYGGVGRTGRVRFDGTRRDHDDEVGWPRQWPEYREKHSRLIASFDDVVLVCVKGLAIQPIYAPGVVGVVDLESGVPDVSRREIRNADIADIVERAKSAMRPQITESLNALGGEGLLIDKQVWLAMCVLAYGERALLDASVPWINFLKLPGEVHLVSCAELLKRLSRAKSLFIALGTGPWTAMRYWVSMGTSPPKNEPAIVLDDTRFDRLHYQTVLSAKS